MNFWYSYVKPKYDENANLCYMGTDSFIVHVKTEDIYKDIAEDFETRFGTSNFELDKTLAKGKKKSNWIKERWIRWTNHEIIYWIESKKGI